MIFNILIILFIFNIVGKVFFILGLVILCVIFLFIFFFISKNLWNDLIEVSFLDIVLVDNFFFLIFLR